MITLRALEIEQILLNGKKYTAFSLYHEVEGRLDFLYKQYIKGHYKKESTILRKYAEQQLLED